MDKRQVVIKLAADTLGLEFGIDSFQDRLISQKAIYLIQAAGTNLGYHYRWYLRGPYCSPLADDCYSIATQTTDDELENWSLDGVTISKLSKIRPMFAEENKETLAKKIELLASLHFLISRGQVSNSSIPEMVNVLEKSNKVFSNEEVHSALGELKEYGLIQ
ncbi:MAG: hypothetical protein K8R02_07505 [Anaerohalosphaeraceae bacterium]|nr:hypothetical protein [Anaerohalosphaeraceae bacterium]